MIFDFIGTLTGVKNYSLEASTMKMYKTIAEAGFDVTADKFLEAYGQAHEKHRIARYQELAEVTNAVWISEALNNLGFQTTPDDTRVKTAVNVFFQDYVDSLKIKPCAKSILEQVSTDYKLGLVSNFTYAPVIYAGLRKLGINQFFNAVLVSEEVGWRKPSRRIFEEALRRLGVTGKETAYVGDSPLEDIEGAKALGMRTIFVPSQFYSLDSLHESLQKPDLIVKDICELCDRFHEFANPTEDA